MKMHEDILAELNEMNNAPIDYSDIPPMTEDNLKTAKIYYEDFMNKLPQEMVNQLLQQRLSEYGSFLTSKKKVNKAADMVLADFFY